MREYRCKNCHKLLFKYDNLDFLVGQASIEIKCDKCSKIQTIIVPIGLTKDLDGKLALANFN